MGKIRIRLLTGLLFGFLVWKTMETGRYFSIYIGLIAIEIRPFGYKWFGFQNDWKKAKLVA